MIPVHSMFDKDIIFILLLLTNKNVGLALLSGMADYKDASSFCCLTAFDQRRKMLGFVIDLYHLERGGGG